MPSIQRGPRFHGGTPPTHWENGWGPAEASSAHGCRQTTVRPGLIAGNVARIFVAKKTIIAFEGEGLPLDFRCIWHAENRGCREDMLLPAVSSLRLACAPYTRMRDDDVERWKG